MAGRKPKPTAVKTLEGNPGKRKLNKKEPIPGKGIPTCPEWLLPEAKVEWNRLSAVMDQMGVLTEVDRAAFAAYCQSYARWKEAQEHIDSEGSTFETDKGYQQQTPWVGIANTNQKLMMQAAAGRAVTFIENLCHTKGKWAGTRFWLLPWQEQLIRHIFGIVKPDGNRQFRTAFIEICKKVGKSELAAAIALYCMQTMNHPLRCMGQPQTGSRLPLYSMLRNKWWKGHQL